MGTGSVWQSSAAVGCTIAVRGRAFRPTECDRSLVDAHSVERRLKIIDLGAIQVVMAVGVHPCETCSISPTHDGGRKPVGYFHSRAVAISSSCRLVCWAVEDLSTRGRLIKP